MLKKTRKKPRKKPRWKAYLAVPDVEFCPTCGTALGMVGDEVTNTLKTIVRPLPAPSARRRKRS